jgi:hypothetical protein
MIFDPFGVVQDIAICFLYLFNPFGIGISVQGSKKKVQRILTTTALHQLVSKHPRASPTIRQRRISFHPFAPARAQTDNFV